MEKKGNEENQKDDFNIFDFHISNVDINHIITDLKMSSATRLNEKSISVSFDEYMPSCYIQTDQFRFSQLMSSLILNAELYTQSGFIKIGYRFINEKTLYFYVCDTGLGIPKEFQKDIFNYDIKNEDISQASHVRLCVCSAIVKKLGGEIGVNSIEGKGSTFWFTLPYVAVPKVVKEKEERKIRILSKEDDKYRLLIAEDDVSNYRLYETILKKEFELFHAWNGKEAIELFKTSQPDIILMDIKMPIMDGYQATAEIRKISTTIPIIAVTAYAFQDDEDQIMSSGFDAYLTKPIRKSLLLEKIKNFLK